MARRLTRQEFVDNLIKKGRTDVVLIGDYKNSATKTLFKCTKYGCGYEWKTRPNNILNGSGCPLCAGKVLVPNVNSVAVIRPDLIKYFKNPDDAYLVMPGSHKKVDIVCPDCGAHRVMTMYNLSFEGFNCKECSAYISYPNRLIRSVMKQLKSKIDYIEYEWSDDWTQRKRYDVYLEKDNKKYIIEMQGSQHFIKGWNDKRSIEEIQSIDEKKINMAIEHNIIPVVIDSQKSDFNFIFNNIKQSILGDIFNFDTIDTNQCQNDITSNIIKQVCEKYQNECIMIKDLSEEFQVSKTTITKYLKIGSEIGWCQYVAGENNKTKVRVYDSCKNIINTYSSISECVCELSKIYNKKFFSANISRACRNGYSCNGLFFEYA